MRILFTLSVFLSLFACQNSSQRESKNLKAKEFDLYQPSEMAIYMNRMYEYHAALKDSITKGQYPQYFSQEVLDIHTAEMSSFKMRNETFLAFATLFEQKVMFIFDQESEIAIEQRYNEAINLCISCHQSECTGPIPLIKKLLIQ